MDSMYATAGVTPEELEKYRDSDGYINLDALNIEFPEGSREIMGNAFREKNWIDFDGKKALFKERVLLGDVENSSIYSELIVEELAKQVGMKCAHCDLAKVNGKFGILSYSIVKDKEQMFSLDSFIGDTIDSVNYPDVMDLVDVLKKTIESMKKEGMSREEIQELITDMEKLFAFDTFIAAADRHAENISLLSNSQGIISLAPIYDNENSLMLDMDNELLDTLSNNPIAIKRSVDVVDPKISVIPDGTPGASLWKTTIDELCASDEVYDFMMDCYENLNMQEALNNVESRIGTKLPERVKKVATLAFDYRKREINQVMCRGYDPEEYDKER